MKKKKLIFLIYDITQQKTFDKINEWIKDIKELKGENFPIVLIGNKCDLEEKRIINKDDGENYARKNEIDFYETSCKDGTNIENSVLTLLNKVIEQKNEGKEKKEEKEKKEKEQKEEKEENQTKKEFKLSKTKNEKKKKRHC